VRATGINHVSIPAVDPDRSVRFYREVFGMEEVPAPSFGFSRPVRWLRLGDLQLHLFPVDGQPERTTQHLGIEVDDFEEAYRRVKELGVFASPGDRPAAVWVLPSGQLQMYLRDPADNLVEINAPDVEALDRTVFGDDLVNLADEIPQTEENLRARLFLRETASA
jgi:catechol 2,3-dioxygenase-like lactoylglutathione lyase family enzyme